MARYQVRAPYAPGDTVVRILRWITGRELPDTVDAESLERIGVSRALALRTLDAFRFLNLVDWRGAPTENLRGLRDSVADESYRKRLGDIVRSAYKGVLGSEYDLSELDLDESFGRLSPPSQRYRMEVLFTALCQEAGIPIQERLRLPSRPAERSRRSLGQRLLDEPGTSRYGRARDDPAAFESSLIAGIVRWLPPPGTALSPEQLEAWLDLMRRALSFEYSEAEDAVTGDQGRR